MVEAFRALKRRELEEALRILGAGQPSRRKKRRIDRLWKSNPKGSSASQGEFKNASSIWLEIQYGWRPLLNDIYESAQAIVKAEDQSPRRVKTTGSNQSFSESVSTQSTANSVTSKVTKDVILVKGTVTVWYATPNTPRTLLQLGFTNPAYLAWELTPFSFVVDWFIPIGNAINNFDATMGCTFDKGCYSEKISTSRRVQISGKVAALAATITSGSSTNFASAQKFQRTVLLSFPSVNFPEFKNPLSTEHALNAIALLIQVFSGKSQ